MMTNCFTNSHVPHWEEKCLCQLYAKPEICQVVILIRTHFAEYFYALHLTVMLHSVSQREYYQQDKQ